MWTLALLLFLQAGPPQREIIGPFVSREDQGQTTKVVLKNGLTVIVREEYAVPLAGITALVKAGHFDEEDRVSGISNLIALLHSTGDTRSLGGDFTATASAETTVYRITVPAANAFAALGVQADAL